ncbi:MFS transporter [Kamptonema formosum]|uniref:MFS transporter n=1 Tax=Kamptonema formosum TaxID=331992 RepID=UPI000345AA60|nr:MFS transporter [Oscillatoria sp. PCC 10802]
MKFSPKSRWRSWLPQLNPQVWILAAGRLLSAIGTGFTLFYAPLFFARGLGLPTTAVGIALGTSSLAGVFGRVLSSILTDSPAWGRRRTLLLSTFISAAGCFVLAAATNFPVLIAGNLLLGVGGGLYWPATEAIIADLTAGGPRHEAYALARLAENLGLQLGVVLGGILISLTGAYRTLFLIDAISFLVFFAVIYSAITETYQPAPPETSEQTTNRSHSPLNGWAAALRDRALLIYVAVNIMFTSYICQIQTTMPLYFSDFVSAGQTGKGFSTETISGLFTWYMASSILFQLPVARFLRRFSDPLALTGSALLWGIGFPLIALTGISPTAPLIWAMLGLSVLAIATVSYTPFASSLVVQLAPESLRGVYFAINAQCWAIGYFIGPPLGGWALDQSPAVAHSFWLVLSLSAGVAVLILRYLDQMLIQRK